MTPNPPNTTDILSELRKLNKVGESINAKLRQAVDPAERLLTSFTKASEQQVKALSMGFKKAGFGDSFSEVSKQLKGVIPALDAVDVAATLFEGGLKEVNEINKKTGQLNNKNIVTLAARMKATGQDFGLVADNLLPLAAQMRLNTEGADKLAKRLQDNIKATGMSAEALLKLTRNLPGAATFGVFGAGGEFAAAAQNLLGMFKDLAPELNKTFEMFFAEPLEGMQKALALGVGEEFRRVLDDPSKENLQTFLTQASRAAMNSVEGVDRLLKTTIGGARLLGDKEGFLALAAIEAKDLFKTLPETVRTNVDTVGEDFKHSILNMLEMVFDPMAELMASDVIPKITEDIDAFSNAIFSLSIAMGTAKMLGPLMNIATKNPLLGSILSKVFGVAVGATAAAATSVNPSVSGPGFTPPPGAPTLAPPGYVPPPTPPPPPPSTTPPPNPTGSRGRGAFLGPLQQNGLYLAEQLAKSLKQESEERSRNLAKNNKFMDSALAQLERIAETNLRMANEPKEKKVNPLVNRSETNTA